MGFHGTETLTCAYCKKTVTIGCIVPGEWRNHEVIEGFRGIQPIRKYYDVCSERCEKLFMGMKILGGGGQ